jgi:hypothetical protein
LVAAMTVTGVGAEGAGVTDPTVASCWGTVVSQRATTSGDIGQHSSSQSEPRAGVGNLAQDFGTSVGGVGQFLGTIDGDPATHCP